MTNQRINDYLLCFFFAGRWFSISKQKTKNLIYSRFFDACIIRQLRERDLRTYTHSNENLFHISRSMK